MKKHLPLWDPNGSLEILNITSDFECNDNGCKQSKTITINIDHNEIGYTYELKFDLDKKEELILYDYYQIVDKNKKQNENMNIELVMVCDIFVSDNTLSYISKTLNKSIQYTNTFDSQFNEYKNKFNLTNMK
jgi:hypothetical protein